MTLYVPLRWHYPSTLVMVGLSCMDVSRVADGSRTIPGLGGTGCLPISVVPSSCVTNSLLYAPSSEGRRWAVGGLSSVRDALALPRFSTGLCIWSGFAKDRRFSSYTTLLWMERTQSVPLQHGDLESTHCSQQAHYNTDNSLVFATECLENTRIAATVTHSRDKCL